MAAQHATVVRGTAGAFDASFQVGLVSGRDVHVRLRAFEGRIRDTISGTSVPAHHRTTLEIPEQPPVGKR
jgi:hypothetical protein